MELLVQRADKEVELEVVEGGLHRVVALLRRRLDDLLLNRGLL